MFNRWYIFKWLFCQLVMLVFLGVSSFWKISCFFWERERARICFCWRDVFTDAPLVNHQIKVTIRVGNILCWNLTFPNLDASAENLKRGNRGGSSQLASSWTTVFRRGENVHLRPSFRRCLHWWLASQLQITKALWQFMAQETRGQVMTSIDRKPIDNHWVPMWDLVHWWYLNWWTL